MHQLVRPGGSWLCHCTPPAVGCVISGRARERIRTKVLSTFLCPYMVVNHAGEGGAVVSLCLTCDLETGSVVGQQQMRSEEGEK